MSKNSILLINDVTGYGRVSTFAMLPVLAHCGYHPYVLPTALVSNTMDYGSAAILDTADFMRNTINKWREFGFGFDFVSTGLINSAQQADTVIDLIDTFRPGFVLVDPIMADYGSLYPDMYPGAIECNRKLLSKSDLVIPNFTEATMLAGMYEGREVLSEAEYKMLVGKLGSLGASDIVITSCRDSNNKCYNLVYDSGSDETEKVYYDNVEGTFIGTGDVFSATLISALISGRTLSDSVKTASDFVREVIRDNLDNPDHYDLIIEKSLNKLKIV